jgi:hypothetical protein
MAPVKEAPKNSYRDYRLLDEAAAFNPHYTAPAPADDGLPAYSGPSSSSDASAQISTTGLPNIDFAKYEIPESTVSDDNVTTMTNLSILSQDPVTLEKFIREQASLPPKPHVRITGTHTKKARGCGDDEDVVVTDFDVKLNLLPYIVREEGDRWNYVKLVDDNEEAFRGGNAKTTGQGGEGLKDWVERFCEDSAKFKSFTLERVVHNWDTDYLDGQIRALIAAINYQGHLSITFPISRSRVTVNAPLEVSSVRFTWPYTWWTSRTVLQPKKYEVVKSVWPYAKTAAQPREYAVQGEESWWSDWKFPIRHAILSKSTGWVSVEDRMEVAIGGLRGLNESPKNWGVDGYDYEYKNRS